MPEFRVVVSIEAPSPAQAETIVEEAMAELMDTEEPQDELWDFPWDYIGIEVKNGNEAKV
jgi:hypothetical protein